MYLESKIIEQQRARQNEESSLSPRPSFLYWFSLSKDGQMHTYALLPTRRGDTPKPKPKPKPRDGGDVRGPELVQRELGLGLGLDRLGVPQPNIELLLPEEREGGREGERERGGERERTVHSIANGM